MQLDVASSQLLVTDNDFQDPAFRQQLSETFNNLIKLRVVLVFNENDAISTRKALYKVGIRVLKDFRLAYSALNPFKTHFLDPRILIQNK